TALINSESDGNFRSIELCCQLSLQKTINKRCYQAQSITGKPLSRGYIKIMSALEPLLGTSIFTKLDLHSTYDLIRKCKGDERKIAFVTPTGYYEYCVMPYGLVNAPSIFHYFMHKVLREFLNKFVLVYIDNILIYSQSLAIHCCYVTEVLKML
ncbi:RNA-directed DNA polymerase homolog, partial [Sinocyclocheilus anshuiensis]|uniref:RNA-directed DNA polymerase homolog n=1 Tax=Sinocyclocheilus anshuiensis TaxID=1608454 RepID=UPI0007B95E65